VRQGYPPSERLCLVD